jgi:hypothetical protein
MQGSKLGIYHGLLTMKFHESQTVNPWRTHCGCLYGKGVRGMVLFFDAAEGHAVRFEAHGRITVAAFECKVSAHFGRHLRTTKVTA